MSVETIDTRALGEVIDVSALMVVLEACSSRSEAKRLIRQDAVEIDGERAGDTAVIFDGSILHVGKRFWRKLALPTRKLTFERTGNQVEILAID